MVRSELGYRLVDACVCGCVEGEGWCTGSKMLFFDRIAFLVSQRNEMLKSENDNGNDNDNDNEHEHEQQKKFSSKHNER